MVIRRALRLVASGALVATAGLGVVSVVEAHAQARVVAEDSADLPLMADQAQGQSVALTPLDDSSW
ncbi:hypothetical protein ACIOFV_15320 [Streptomyces mirabilis]|uniref:hypothetical protein n=1 Tax=Streptomyces mirabilis TaxID=68239 RepID=UPI0038070076